MRALAVLVLLWVAGATTVAAAPPRSATAPDPSPDPTIAIAALPSPDATIATARAPVVGSAAAHPVSLLWAQIRVHKDKIDVELVITVEEFYYVYELDLDENGELAESDIRESMEAYRDYLLEHLTFRDSDGERLEGKVTEASLMPSEFVLPMEREVTYEVTYPLEMPLLSLEIEQSFGGKDSAFPAVMTMEIEQVDYTLPEPFLLEKGAVAEVRFDWLAAPLSEALEDPETLEERRRELLGITSFGSIYTFLYVEETEVRHEILIPVATLETWVPIDRAKTSVLTVEEQKAAIDEIHQFFARHNPVTLDGIEVKPQLERVDFFDLEFKDLAQRPPERPVPVYAARVGIILEYPTKGVPDRVEMTWDLFSRDLRDVTTVLIAWDDSERIAVSEESPVVTWSNPGRPPLPQITSIEAAEAQRPPFAVPVVTAGALLLCLLPLGRLLARTSPRPRRWAATLVVLLVAAGIGWFGPTVSLPDPRDPVPAPPSEGEADAILASLHRNVYRAFDYRAEGDVYDALARSVSGELLSDLFLKIREGLRMQEQGGAVSRVETVTLESTEPEAVDADASSDPRAFRRRLAWTVRGTVEHWGHIHSRTSRFEASLTVEPIEAAWKITALDVRDQERVDFRTSIRKVL